MGFLSDINWWKASSVRAIKTIAQTAVALIGTSAVILTEVDWLFVASGSILAGVLSLLTSIGGLPEHKEESPVELDDKNVEEVVAEDIETLPDEELIEDENLDEVAAEDRAEEV